MKRALRTPAANKNLGFQAVGYLTVVLDSVGHAGKVLARVAGKGIGACRGFPVKVPMCSSSQSDTSQR